MKNEKGKVNAENVGGTHDQEHEIEKRVSKHVIIPPSETIDSDEDKVKKDKNKITGVHAENVGGTAAE